jgi:O-antigen/teichoic acid export membrane protein
VSSPPTDAEPRPPAPEDATRRQIRGSTLLLAGRAVAIALNFAAQVLIVRHLAKGEYGAFAYALAVAAVGAHLVGLGLDKGVTRFVPIYQERRRYDAMAGTIALALATMAGFGIAFVTLVIGVAGVVGERVAPDARSLSLLLVLIWAAPLQAVDNVTVKLFAIFASPRAVFFRRHVLTPGLRLAAVAALLAFEGDALFLAFAWLLSGLAGVAISLAVIAQVLRAQGLLRHFRPREMKVPSRRLLRFSVPLLSTDLVTAMRGNLVVFLLGMFHAAASVATFRAVFPVARLNVMVFDSFKLLFSPTAARLYARNDRQGMSELYWRSACWITVLGFPIFAASFSLADPLTVLLFGERYAESGAILAFLSVGYFVNATLGFNALTLRVFNRVRAIVVIDFVSLAFALCSNLALIPAFGALGGAMASCATLILQNALAQATLVRVGAVRAVDPRFLRVAASAVGMAAALFAVQSLLSPPLYVGLALVAAASLLVLAVNLPVLDVHETFPELDRIPPLRRMLPRRAPDVDHAKRSDAVS